MLLRNSQATFRTLRNIWKLTKTLETRFGTSGNFPDASGNLPETHWTLETPFGNPQSTADTLGLLKILAGCSLRNSLRGQYFTDTQKHFCSLR